MIDIQYSSIELSIKIHTVETLEESSGWLFGERFYKGNDKSQLRND